MNEKPNFIIVLGSLLSTIIMDGCTMLSAEKSFPSLLPPVMNVQPHTQ